MAQRGFRHRGMWVWAMALVAAALWMTPAATEAQPVCPPGADPNSPGCRGGGPPPPGVPPAPGGLAQAPNPCFPAGAHLINRPGTLSVTGSGAGAVVQAQDMSGIGTTFTGPMSYAFQGAVLGPNSGAPGSTGPGNLRAAVAFTFVRPAGVVRYTSACALEVDTFFQPTGDRGAVFIVTQGTISGLDHYSGPAWCYMHLQNSNAVASGKVLDFGCNAGTFCGGGAFVFDSRTAVSPFVFGALNQFIGRMTGPGACP